MENASKALIMAGGVLIGILILSLAVFIFTDFGATSKGIYSEVESNQLTQYNAQYTIYSGRDDITIYEIISVANLAKDNNEYYKDYSNYESEYKVIVNLIGEEIQENSSKDNQELIDKYSDIDENSQELKNKFKCTEIEYHLNGKVKSITFVITLKTYISGFL